MDLFLIPIKINACNIKSQRIQEHLEATFKSKVSGKAIFYLFTSLVMSNGDPSES